MPVGGQVTRRVGHGPDPSGFRRRKSGDVTGGIRADETDEIPAQSAGLGSGGVAKGDGARVGPVGVARFARIGVGPENLVMDPVGRPVDLGFD